MEMAEYSRVIQGDTPTTTFDLNLKSVYGRIPGTLSPVRTESPLVTVWIRQGFLAAMV